MYLDVIGKEFNLTRCTRHALVLEGGTLIFVLAFLVCFSFSFPCSACALSMFLANERAFFDSLFLLSMIRFPFCFCCCFLPDRCPRTGLTRRAATILACIDVGALQSPAHRSSVFTSSPVTANLLHYSLSFIHRAPGRHALLLYRVPWRFAAHFRLYAVAS